MRRLLKLSRPGSLLLGLGLGLGWAWAGPAQGCLVPAIESTQLQERFKHVTQVDLAQNGSSQGPKELLFHGF